MAISKKTTRLLIGSAAVFAAVGTVAIPVAIVYGLPVKPSDVSVSSGAANDPYYQVKYKTALPTFRQAPPSQYLLLQQATGQPVPSAIASDPNYPASQYKAGVVWATNFSDSKEVGDDSVTLTLRYENLDAATADRLVTYRLNVVKADAPAAVAATVTFEAYKGYKVGDATTNFEASFAGLRGAAAASEGYPFAADAAVPATGTSTTAYFTRSSSGDPDTYLDTLAKAKAFIGSAAAATSPAMYAVFVTPFDSKNYEMGTSNLASIRYIVPIVVQEQPKPATA